MATVLALAVAPAARARRRRSSCCPIPRGKLDSPASIAAAPDQTMWIANAGPLHAARPGALRGRPRRPRRALPALPHQGRDLRHRRAAPTAPCSRPSPTRAASRASPPTVASPSSRRRRSTPGRRRSRSGRTATRGSPRAGLGGTAKIGRITPAGRITRVPGAAAALPGHDGPGRPRDDRRRPGRAACGSRPALGSARSRRTATWSRSRCRSPPARPASRPPPTARSGSPRARCRAIDRLTPGRRAGPARAPRRRRRRLDRPRPRRGDVLHAVARRTRSGAPATRSRPIDLQVVDRVKRRARPKLAVDRRERRRARHGDGPRRHALDRGVDSPGRAARRAASPSSTSAGAASSPTWPATPSARRGSTSPTTACALGRRAAPRTGRASPARTRLPAPFSSPAALVSATFGKCR